MEMAIVDFIPAEKQRAADREENEERLLHPKDSSLKGQQEEKQGWGSESIIWASDSEIRSTGLQTIIVCKLDRQ
jgi:hypothetical protein